MRIAFNVGQAEVTLIDTDGCDYTDWSDHELTECCLGDRAARRTDQDVVEALKEAYDRGLIDYEED